jgi:mitogen-activated protein kinase 15
LTIYDVVPARDDKHLYLVTEVLDADLAKVIKSSPMQEYQQKFVTYQILRALKYIHSAGVIHRDVKPANVFINRQCEARLGDFGWARGLPASMKEGGLTEYAAARWYRSPEMLLGGNRYTSSSDIWSLGCIAGEMCGREIMIPGSCTQSMIDIIIDMIGKPSHFDIVCMEAQYAELMLECLPVDKPRRPIPVRFGGQSPEFIEFLQLIFQMNPEKRMDAQEALQHPHMGNFHNPDDEPVFGRRIALPVPDHQLLSATRYRVQIYADYLLLPQAKRELEELRRKELKDEASLFV